MALNRYLFHLSSFLTIVACVVCSARAQDDALISFEPRSAIVPPDARMQAAARIGLVALAVWGTGIPGDPGKGEPAVIPSLVMQIAHLDDGSVIGEPRALHSISGRPRGNVAAVALSDRYLVFWNDYRADAPGIYLQRVSLAGDPIGDEERMTGGMFDTTDIAAVPVRDGWLLLWSDPEDVSPKILGRRIGANGMFSGSVEVIASGTLTGVDSSIAAGGRWIVERRDHAPLVVDIDGGTRRLFGARDEFAGVYYIDRDGSVIAHDGKNLSFYTRVFDTSPASSIPFSTPQRAIRNSPRIAHGPGGRLMILHAVSYDGITPNSSGAISGGIILYGHEIRDDRSIGGLEEIRVMSTPSVSTAYRFTVSPIVAGWQARCDSTIVFSIRSRIAGSYNQPPVSYTYAYDFTAQTAIDKSGNVVIATLPTDCAWRGGVTIARIGDSASSRVSVGEGERLVLLSAPTATEVLDVMQYRPGITVRDGRLLTAWRSTGTDTTYGLARLHTGDGLHAERIGKISDPWPPRGILNATVEDSLVQVGDRFLLSSLYRFWQAGIDRTQLVVYVPSDTGWRMVRVMTFDNVSAASPHFGYDPGRREIVGAITTGNLADTRRNVYLFGIDEEGDVRWRVDSVTTIMQGEQIGVIPIGMEEFLFITSNNVAYHRGGTVTKTFKLPAVGAPAGYHYAFGQMFVRSYQTSPNMLTLEMYDVHGELKQQRRIDFDRGVRDHVLVPDHVNPGFVLLTAGESGGVRIMLLDRELRTRRGDRQISAYSGSVRRPAVTFRGDSIHVVWEDERDGVSDIYGTSLSLRVTGNVDDDAGRRQSIAIESVEPNPARDIVEVVLDIEESDATELVIVDVLGDVRLRIPLERGSDRVSISTSDLPSGHYRVVLRGEQNIDAAPLIVQ